jgi:hypothetical protein
MSLNVTLIIPVDKPLKISGPCSAFLRIMPSNFRDLGKRDTIDDGSDSVVSEFSYVPPSHPRASDGRKKHLGGKGSTEKINSAVRYGGFKRNCPFG